MAHIYNLRKSATYRKRRIVYQATKPVSVSIGERRKPDPQGRPRYLRVDTVIKETAMERRRCAT